MLDTRKRANDMKSFEYLSVRYWSKEINGTGCGFGDFGAAIAHHISLVAAFKK